MAVKSDGTLWAWGRNDDGLFGNGTTTNSSVPVQIGTDTKWVSIAAAENHTAGIKSDGTLWTCGNNTNGELGYTTALPYGNNSFAQVGGDRWASVACGSSHTIGIRADGTLWTWGNNTYQQIGDGTFSNRFSPYQVGTDTKWVSAAAGYGHSVALKSDGTVWAWGYAFGGQLGNGSIYPTSVGTPTQVGTDTKWTAVAAGLFHSLGVKSDGVLWAWGTNTYGQLGDGTNTIRTLAVPVTTSPGDWLQVSQGSSHTVALRSDGTLWAWGDNASGQLGDGTNTDRTAPVRIGTEVSWVSVTAGTAHTVGLKSNGTLWSWGDNAYGQLGRSVSGSSNAPGNIPSPDYKWTGISAGRDFTLGIKSDGTLWAWGRNTSGQIGDGTTTSKPAPVQIGTGTTWTVVNTGYQHASALRSDGSFWAWGDNSYGQLGDGTTTDRYTPTQIAGQNNIVAMSRGSSSSTTGTLVKSDRSGICLTGLYALLGNGTNSASLTSFACDNCIKFSAPTAASTALTKQLNSGWTHFQTDCSLIASVSPAGAAPVSGTVTARVINDATVQSFNGKAYVTRHYDIAPVAGANTATANIALSFTQAEFDAYNAANGTVANLPTGPGDATGIANLRITQFHGTPTGGYAPANYPTTRSGAGPVRVLLTPTLVTWVPDSRQWRVLVNVTGFSGFFAHGNTGTALPLRAGSFAARALSNTDVLLRWEIDAPQEDAGYTVERSGDGAAFEAVGTATAGTATAYSLHDLKPLAGRSYYRLKTADRSGAETYSEVQSVYIRPGGAAISLYPSPATDYVVVESSARGALEGVLTNMQGRVLLPVVVQSGARIPLTGLAPGLYLLRLDDGSVFKIVKD